MLCSDFQVLTGTYANQPRMDECVPIVCGNGLRETGEDCDLNLKSFFFVIFWAKDTDHWLEFAMVFDFPGLFLKIFSLGEKYAN